MLSGVDITKIKDSDSALFRREHLGFVFQEPVGESIYNLYTDVVYIIPVSYTHLDVYKRQVHTSEDSDALRASIFSLLENPVLTVFSRAIKIKCTILFIPSQPFVTQINALYVSEK